MHRSPGRNRPGRQYHFIWGKLSRAGAEASATGVPTEAIVGTVPGYQLALKNVGGTYHASLRALRCPSCKVPQVVATEYRVSTDSHMHSARSRQSPCHCADVPLCLHNMR
jgi:hypothetical protein